MVEKTVFARLKLNPVMLVKKLYIVRSNHELIVLVMTPERSLS